MENANIATIPEAPPPSSSKLRTKPVAKESATQRPVILCGGIAYFDGSHLAANSHINQQGEIATTASSKPIAMNNAISNFQNL